jgi:hypothetical protein
MDALRRSVEAERGGSNDKLHPPPNGQRRKNRVSVRPTSPAARTLWHLVEVQEPGGTGKRDGYRQKARD